MIGKIKPLWIRLILAILAFTSLLYSADQYGNDGCDGGLCAVNFFAHGLPLMLSWLFFCNQC